jgi:hypothetical protein
LVYTAQNTPNCAEIKKKIKKIAPGFSKKSDRDTMVLGCKMLLVNYRLSARSVFTAKKVFVELESCHAI